MRSAWIIGMAAFVVIGLVFAGAAEASVVKKTIPDLTAESDIVIHGKVKGSWSYWLDGAIVTEYTVQIQSNVLGNPGGETVPVIVQGGVVGDIGLHVSDQPEFSPRQEVVLFLQGTGNDGGFAVAGLFQGKVDVKGGRVPAFDMTLDEFLGRVQAGGVGLDEGQAKPPGTPGGGKGGGGGGGGEKCYKTCTLSWKVNGDIFDGKTHPGLEDNGTFHWSINNISNDFADQELVDELQAAADVWNNAGACWGLGTVDSTITHDNGLTNASFDGRNAVTFGDVGSAVAVVSNWYYRNDRKNTIETDMTFNDRDYDYGINVCDSETEFDLMNVAVHEFGHWICLADQYDAGDVDHSMYGYVAEGECKKQTLHQCDIDGAKAVYGACN